MDVYTRNYSDIEITILYCGAAIRMKGLVIILKRWNLEIHFMLGQGYKVKVCIIIGYRSSSRGINSLLSRLLKLTSSFTILILAGVVFLHISIDLLNDYWDYVKGIDKITKRTKFSGVQEYCPVVFLKRSTFTLLVYCSWLWDLL